MALVRIDTRFKQGKPFHISDSGVVGMLDLVQRTGDRFNGRVFMDAIKDEAGSVFVADCILDGQTTMVTIWTAA